MKRFGSVVVLFSILFIMGLVVTPLFTSSAFAQQEQTQSGQDDATEDDGTTEDPDADADDPDADADDSDDDADDPDTDADDPDDSDADDPDADEDGEDEDDDAEVDDDDADEEEGDEDAEGSGKEEDNGNGYQGGTDADDDDEAEDDDDADEEEDKDEYDYDYDDDAPELKVYPKKAEVLIGETIKFEFEVRGIDENDDEDNDSDDAGDEEADDDADDDEGVAEKVAVEAEDIIVTWEVSDPEVGSIDEEGLFTALAEGKVTVTATADTLSGKARVNVIAEESQGETHRHRMSLFRETLEGKVNKFGAPTSENDSVTLGGFPFPLNIFNGSKLSIPENALSEDVSITIELPDFAEVDETEEDVEFTGEIIAGVNFVVSVDGVVIEDDYYFEEPLVITIPFKRGLLDKLGLVPEDLGLYFANDTGEIEDNGITDIVVDPDNNTITGKVPHFSTVVVAPKTAAPTSVEDEDSVLPAGITLSQNVPNPFNPSTAISFSISKQGNVAIDVFNIAGQKVDTLVSDLLPAGNHTFTWNASQFSAGIYFYTVKSGDISKTMKMMLLK